MNLSPILPGPCWAETIVGAAAHRHGPASKNSLRLSAASIPHRESLNPPCLRLYTYTVYIRKRRRPRNRLPVKLRRLRAGASPRKSHPVAPDPETRREAAAHSRSRERATAGQMPSRGAPPNKRAVPPVSPPTERVRSKLSQHSTRMRLRPSPYSIRHAFKGSPPEQEGSAASLKRSLQIPVPRNRRGRAASGCSTSTNRKTALHVS
jgi:hypothetical protein